MTYTHDRTMLARLGFADPDKKNPTHDLACQYLALPVNAQAVVNLFVKAEACATEGNWRGVGRMLGKRIFSPTAEKAKLECAIHKGHGQYQTTIGFLDVVISYRVPWKEAGTLSISASYKTLYEHVTEDKDRLRWRHDDDDAAITGQLLEVVRPVFNSLRSIQQQIRDVKHLEKDTRSQREQCMGPFTHYSHTITSSYSSTADNGCPLCLPECPCQSLINEGSVLKSSMLTASTVYVSEGHEPSSAIVIEVKSTPTSLGEVLRQFNLYKGYVVDSRVIWVLVTTYDLGVEERVALEREGIKHLRLGTKFEKWCAEQRVSSATATGQIEI